MFLPAYIGPGAGFAFLGSFTSLLLSIAAAFVSLALWPLRMAAAMIRGGLVFRRARVKKLIFLGLDGFDPRIAERMMAEGKLPNLARLKEQGGYRRLRTTFPALSPVAWSTFATGVNPGRHNIFDFLSRDPRTYTPELSSAKIRPDSIEMRRKSEPFWKILSRHAIRSTILRVPITFPPDRFHGHMLSAMATPDLRGTQGDFTLFTEKGYREDAKNRRPLELIDGEYVGSLEGPPGEFIRLRVRVGRADNRASLVFEEHVAQALSPVRLFLSSRGLKASIGKLGFLGAAGRFNPAQAKAPVPHSCATFGQYTPWVRLRFRSASGIARFLLINEDPVAVYVTPVQIDPENPIMPISHPRYFAMYLSKLLGAFATAGMAEDTSALNEDAISPEAFLDQTRSIQSEREAMFFSSLERIKRGAVACVFDTPDRVQHMFYRQFENAPEASVIEQMYRDMDRIAGRAMQYADRRTALFILSDHGFCSFRRGVNLNAWLRDERYLFLEDGREESGDYLEGINWSRTRAYTFGLGGIYLNLRGREAKGIVEPEEALVLIDELKAKLAALIDTAQAEAPVPHCYAAKEIYNGPYSDAAPDLVVGYAAGYRASWDAAIGKVTREVFTDNNKAWSGDHCVDPALVPGVLFSNLKISADNPGIEDMAPTALDLFGIKPPAWMEGAPICGPA